MTTQTTNLATAFIPTDSSRAIARALVPVLSETDRTLRRTQLAHWNVTGANFFGLHAALEEQYNDLFAAVDALAERIRALGVPVPGDYAASGDNVPQGNEVPAAIASHEDTVTAIDAALQVASEAGDEVTAGMLLDRLGTHQKTLWMLRATQQA